MIQVTAQSRIYLAVEPADFRKGIDGLSALCRQRLKGDPFSGSLYVFRNRRKTAVKVLFYDGQGFWLCMKRFSKGKLNWWPDSADSTVRLNASEFQLLLWNGNPETASIAEDWRRVG